MKAVIYCRVSTREQVQNLSLGTQLKACRQYCDREGYEIAKEFTDEGESAKTIDRPEFQRLLDYCRSNKRQVGVVVYNVTRFSRNTHDFTAIRAYLQGLGISVRSVNEPLGEDSVGNLTGAILAAIAQFENDEKARRTKDGMRAALELGRWPFQPPLGYVRTPLQKGVLALDPVRAPLVRQAFELYATGRFDKSRRLHRMTALGLRTLAGKPLAPQSFGNLLRNRVYAGWLTVPSWKLSLRGDFEPIVSESLFQRVQRLLDGKGEPVRPHSRNHPDFPLRRFVACSHCETPLTASWSSGRNKKYAYYHCRKCGGVNTPKIDVEARFVELLTKLRPDAGYMRLFNAIVMDVYRHRQADAERLRTDLERVLRQKRQKLSRVEDAFLFERSIDQRKYEQMRDALRKEIALAEAELSDAIVDHLDREGLLAFAEHLVTNAARLWIAVNLDQKQQLQQAFFPECLRFDGEKFGTAVTCLAFK